MSTSPTSPPSLDSVLTSLRHHLLPSPLLSSLPSALTLFAHLQLLSRVVRSQATEALRVHDDLVTRLAEEGVSAEDMLRRGILTRVERRRLKRWARRDEGDEMFGFSLEMRKHHLAKLCTSPNIPLAAVTSMIDTYFPSLPSASSTKEFQTARDRHPMLFVRIMTPDQALVLGQYRSIVLGWHGLLARSDAGTRKPLRIEEITPGAPAQILEKLAEKIIKDAEAVIRDAGEFEAMFSSAGVGNTSGSLKLDQVEEKRRIHSGPSENRRASRLLHHFANPADIPQHTLALAQPIPPSSSEAGPSRPRASLPAAIRLRDSRNSLSPEPALDIPHLTFDTTRGGRLRARGSIERRSQTPFLRGHTPTRRQGASKVRGSTPLFQPASPSPSPSDDGDAVGVGAQIEPTHFPEHATTGSARPVGDPAGPSEGTGSGLNVDTSIDTKPIIKKRRRVSGLPPETGPDYTASSPKQNAQAAPKSKLRPFESSQIVRPKRHSRGAGAGAGGGDENSPRVAKRAREEGREGREGLAEGDSQENSQEGVGPVQASREMGVVEVVRKLDKGKGR